MSHACHRFLEMLPNKHVAHLWQGAQSLAPATQNDTWTSKSGANMWCFVHFDFEMCFAPQRRALFRHLNFQKWSEHVVVFNILTWKRASRHNGVHFFDISTSKSGPNMRCFVHFDFEICFAPQRRALFRHGNFQKWSDNGVFCTFWLRNVLRATTACTFSTSQLPKVVRSWCALYILTSKCASRRNGVQFFISHLASWLRTCRFSEPTFRPSGATNHEKNRVFRDFSTFLRTWIFFLLTRSLLWSLFYSSLLSDSSCRCFSCVHIVGSLTSKLPSISWKCQLDKLAMGNPCAWLLGGLGINFQNNVHPNLAVSRQFLRPASWCLLPHSMRDMSMSMFQKNIRDLLWCP